MPKNIVNGFAAGRADESKKGRHSCAANKIVKWYRKRSKKLVVPRNPLGRKKQKQASVIMTHWDERMQVSVDKKRALYYRNPLGIDMTYPHGAKVAKLDSLKIVSNHSLDENFNVIVGCKNTNKQELTFIALKVSESQKKIEPELMKIYDASLKGMLMTKPNVIRGALRNGLEEQYVCHGYRKNPLDRDIGEYSFNHGVSDDVKESLKEGVNLLVGEMEKRAMVEMNAANFNESAMFDDYIKMQYVYGWPSVHEWGIGTQFALSKRYASQVHTDADYYNTTLMVYDAEAEPDEVLHYFCFPTYGFAIPMRSGDIIVFNPLVPHCATNPSRDTAMIYSCYVSKKTCNTVVANAMDSLK
jgi:hypothetical protein